MGFPNPRPTPGSILHGAAVGDFVFFDDFLTFGYNAEASSGQASETANDTPWLLTKIDAATDNDESLVISDDEPGGVLAMTTTNADNDSLELQLNGEAFKVADGKDIYFECRFKIGDVSTQDWYVGLATTDTTAIAAATELVGFRCPDATGDVDAVTGNTTAETVTDTGVNLADDTFVTVAFHVINNERVRFFVNAQVKAEHTANVPDGDAVTLTMAIRAGDASTATMEVDYIYCAQVR